MPPRRKGICQHFTWSGIPLLRINAIKIPGLETQCLAFWQEYLIMSNMQGTEGDSNKCQALWATAI